MSENFKPGSAGLEAGELAEDISLYRSTDSLDSLSSGDSDGGPAEPTLAEISMLSASIDARNVEAAKDEVDMASEANEVVEVTPVFPAGFHRLPSAMRPPVRRGHVRSASAGGNVLNFRGGQLQSNVSKPARAAVTNTVSLSTTSAATSAAASTSTANTKVAAVQNQHRQHRRVFSHGHITFGGPGSDSEVMPPKSGGHRRTGSRTDFILPPDHEERERKRSSLQRQDSAPTSASNRQRQGSGFHRRHDSLAFSFRGHSRQASRSDSIYTLRHPKGTWTLKDKLCSFWTRWKSEDLHKERGQVRTIVPNHTIPSDVPRDKHPNCKFANNNISTTKYSWLSFLPKNLFEQFHRFANLYFLFIVILNWVPSISAFGREISMLPLIFVLGVTALKDIFEDRRRYLSDKRVNNYTCRVYKNSVGRYIKTLWKDVKVGDMVHLSVNEMIPADIVVLRSSDEHGLCYIDTQNLDGETNLKQREVPRGFVDRQQNFQPQDFRSSLECDLPTTKIYRFNGTIMHATGEKVPVGKDNLLLRECVLKNTDFIEGMVVYAGKESKAMLNNDGPRYKRSKLEMQMNRDVIWCVFLLLVMCLMGAIGTAVWLGKFTEYVPFLNTLTFEETQPVWEGFLVFWTFVILLQVIIPMSLYVTIEMTKLCQIYLMHQDIRMWDESCGKGLECRALNIPEELGQIQYVFCDKTGTLTENNMVFKRCTIGGQDFAHKPITMQPKFSGSSLASLNHLQTNGLQQAATPTGKPIIPVNPTLNDRLVSADIQFVIEGKETKLRMHPQAGITQDFFLLMAVCNTVIVAKHPHKDMMNASGMICNTSAVDIQKSELQDSVSNCETASIATTVTAVSAPLQPEPSLTPKRSNRFFFTNPLSPIASSPETSPPASPAINRPKHLQLPSLWSKVMGRDGSSSKLNHSSRSPTPTPSEIRPIYEAESPDELALVDAAFAYNCKLIKRSPQSVVVSLPGEGLIEFEVLHVLPFDSDRKRMSIILRHQLTRERILFCKGADSAIFPRLEPAEAGSDEEALLDKTQQHLNMYAKEGLRVLVMAKRILSDNEYEEWLILHETAENSLRMREKLLMESYKRIESNLKLLGATGIEDKLQEGVPNAIENLRQAGIVVWVLTGDKQETAINIAYSCKLFTHSMNIIKLNARSRDATEQMIKKHLEQIRDEQDALTEPYYFQGKTWTKSEFIEHKKRNRAIVVDGKTLVYILDSRANLQHPFLELTEECAAVLGCRATPLQKAFLVGIVKEKLGMHTLAIGDGANDVSMIQTADVGIGISGMEGMQAVMASDFAITKFKYLERLVLVHGHWNYDRLARMVLYFFYKNAAFVFVTFWFQLYAGFSGAVMFDHMYLMLYNLLWTSLPPVAIGVLDQMAPDHVLESKPHLYIRGRKSRVYKPYSFWLNMLDAFYQSLIIFFISFGAYNDMDVGLWECGTTVITASLFVMCLHLAIETKSWTIIHWTSMLLSILFFFAFVLIYNSFCITCFGLQNPFWVIQHTMGSAEYWLIILLTSITALLPRITYRALKNTLKPDPITQEMLSRNRSIHSSSSGTGKSGSRSSAHSTNLSWSRTGSSHASSLRNYSKEETETEMTAIVP